MNFCIRNAKLVADPRERNIFVVRYVLREFLIRVISFNIIVLMRKNLVTLEE
jgi:hypothetical protein